MARLNKILNALLITTMLLVVAFFSFDSGAQAKFVLNSAGFFNNGLTLLAGQSQTKAMQAVADNSSPAVVAINIIKEVPQYAVGSGGFLNSVFAVPSLHEVGTVKERVGAGTGFFISSSGYILTNNHVVDDSGAQFMVELSDGSQKQGSVIFTDVPDDLAVLKVSGTNYPYLKLGDSSSVHLGESVVGIGNALGEFNDTVTTGTISGLNRTVIAQGPPGSASGDETLHGLFQSDAVMYPGDSGGPLLDLSGNVIAVNVAIQDGTNVSFSIPINVAKAALTRAGL